MLQLRENQHVDVTLGLLFGEFLQGGRKGLITEEDAKHQLTMMSHSASHLFSCCLVWAKVCVTPAESGLLQSHAQEQAEMQFKLENRAGGKCV